MTNNKNTHTHDIRCRPKRALAAAVLIAGLTVSMTVSPASAAVPTAVSVAQANDAAGASVASAKVTAPVIQAGQTADGQVRLKRIQDAATSIPGAKFVGYSALDRGLPLDTDRVGGNFYAHGELFDVGSSVPTFCLLDSYWIPGKTVALRAAYELPNGQLVHADSAPVSCDNAPAAPAEWSDAAPSAQIAAPQVTTEAFTAGLRLKRTKDASTTLVGAEFLGYDLVLAHGATVTRQFAPQSDLLAVEGGLLPTWSVYQPTEYWGNAEAVLRATYRAADGTIHYKDSAPFAPRDRKGTAVSTEAMTLPESRLGVEWGTTIDWADADSIGVSIVDFVSGSIGWRNNPHLLPRQHGKITHYLASDGTKVETGSTPSPSYNDSIPHNFHTVKRQAIDTEIVAAIWEVEGVPQMIEPLEPFTVPALRTTEAPAAKKLKIVSSYPGAVEMAFADPADDALLDGWVEGSWDSAATNKIVRFGEGLTDGTLMLDQREVNGARRWVFTYSAANGQDELSETPNALELAAWSNGELIRIGFLGIANADGLTEHPETENLVGHLYPVTVLLPAAELTPGTPTKPVDPTEPTDPPVTPPVTGEPGSPVETEPVEPSPGTKPPVIEDPSPEIPKDSKPKDPVPPVEHVQPKPGPKDPIIGDPPVNPKPKAKPAIKLTPKQQPPAAPTGKPPVQPKHPRTPEVLSALSPAGWQHLLDR